MLTQIDVQMATNQSLGIVKGSSTDGKIFVETDGSMSLKGYDTLVSKDATHDSKISTLETGLGNANARIDATNTNVANNAADIVTANGNISTNTNDINGLKGRMATAEGQIATQGTKINQHTQSINDLTIDVNDLTTDVNNLKNKTRVPKVYTGPIENLITYDSSTNTVRVTKEMIVVYWSRSTQMGIHTSYILPREFKIALSSGIYVYIDKFLMDKFNDYSKFVISGVNITRNSSGTFLINVSIGGQTAYKTNSLDKNFTTDKEHYYMIYTFD